MENIKEIKELGYELAKAGIASNYNPAMGVAIAWDCIHKNISPIDYDRKFYVIQGKVTMKADAMLGALLLAGGSYKIIEETQEVCEIHFKYNSKEYKSRYTIEDAKRNKWAIGKNGKLKDNYAKQPEVMIFARCVSRGMKRTAPDLVYGLYTPEEIRDLGSELSKKATVDDTINRNVVKTMMGKPKQKEVDLSICPIGEHKGKRWTEFKLETLHRCIEPNAIKTVGVQYLEPIKQAIKEKGMNNE